jgi:cobalt-zinc-cadmium efflux system membrane fusion protein
MKPKYYGSLANKKIIMKTYKLISFVLIISLLYSCSGKDKTDEAIAEITDTKADTFMLTNEQLDNLVIETGSVQPQMMSAAAISVTGLVDVPPENIAQVSAVVPGKIIRIAPNTLQGKYVSKGSVLATAQSMELIQLQQDYLQAYYRNDVLSKEVDRQKQLMNNDAGIEKRVQEAENQWKLNKAVVSGLEAKLRLSGINLTKLKAGEIDENFSVYSPISGFLKQINVNTGSSFTENAPLFEIVNRDHLHVELKVFEKDASHLRKGQKVVFYDPVFDVSGATGSVFQLAQNYDSQSKTVNVHFDKKSDEVKLIYGQYLRGEIQVDQRTVNTLPESALIRESHGNFVLVKSSTGEKGIEIRKVPVEIGVIQHGKVEIVNPGVLENVITKGGQRIAGMSEKDSE